MRKYFIKDSNGRASITTTAFFLGFIIVNAKLLLSNSFIFGLQFSEFTGSEYAMAIGALGGVYLLRKNRPETEGK